MVEIAGAGHFVFADQPAQFAAAVKEFLGAH
jgi:pimeloyl-ACP methyl ester carboxylesterase